MITIISGTNRKGSMTLKVAKHYQKIMKQLGIDAHLISLEGLNTWERNAQFLQLEQEVLIPSEKFFFIMPEYNGSFPGILKLMMDNSDIRQCWWHKKAAMVGVANGRGGNLRGIEHMTNILHYLKMNVLYNKLPISKINEEMDTEGQWLRQDIQDAITEQIEQFLKY